MFWHGAGRRTRPDRDSEGGAGFFGIRPGDTLLILGSEDSGLVVSKPEVLDRVAQEILGNLEE